jgi:transcription elongation GreA/GreB family factor
MRVIEQPIQQRIGDGRIAQIFVPRFDRQLARDQRRAQSVTVFDDFQQVVFFGSSANLVQLVLFDTDCCSLNIN